MRERQLDFLKARGFVYDERRQTWTRPPKGGEPKRRPVLVRSAASNRVLEVRLPASDNVEREAKLAAEVVRSVLQSASVASSPRSALEALGMRGVTNVGALGLVGLQVALWALVRSRLTLESLPLVHDDSTLALAGAIFVALAQDAGYARPAAFSGELERAAADVSLGAHAVPAPRAWRAVDRRWRAGTAVLDLAAAAPRCLAFHCAMQAPLDRGLDPFLGSANAGAAAVLVVAAFAAACDAIVDYDPDDAALRRSENAGLRSLLAEPPTESLSRDLARAWLDAFDDSHLGVNHGPRPSCFAFGRAAAAAAAFRLTGNQLVAPIALHAAASLVAILNPADPYEGRDPDRAVYYLQD